MVKTVRLYRRQNVYYIRVSIPVYLNNIVKNREIRYSLNTSTFSLALQYLRRESAKVDMVFNELINKREYIMEKSKTGKIILNKEEVDIILKHRCMDAQEFLKDNNVKLQMNKVKPKNASLLHEILSDDNYNNEVRDLYFFNDEKQEVEEGFREHNRFSKEIVRKYVFDFLNDYINKNNVSEATKELIENSKEEDISFRSSWFYNSLYKKFLAIEEAVLLQATTIKERQGYREGNPVVEEIKNSEITGRISCKTKWEDFFKDKYLNYLEQRNVRENTKTEMFRYLSVLFSFINREYLEDVRYEDCRYITNEINLLPSNYIKKPEFKGLSLKEVIEKNKTLQKPKIALKTYSKYVNYIKKFLSFAYKERVITEKFDDAFELPCKIHKETERTPFTDAELRKIFSKDTYPMSHNPEDTARYWVTLIALHTGMRLNEICQLYVDDIQQLYGGWYICVNKDTDDKRAKTENAKRFVPIHDNLIKIGFLDFVKLVKNKKLSCVLANNESDTDKNRSNRLFQYLNYNSKHGYSNAIGKWFARYLDKIGISDASKVFHCFRHTMMQKMYEANITRKNQNFICGWAQAGTGEKEYLHCNTEVVLKKLREDINKIKFPSIDFKKITKKWK